MSPASLLADRRRMLCERLRDGWEQAPADAAGFAARLLSGSGIPAETPADRPSELGSGGTLAAHAVTELIITALAPPNDAALTYGGAPAVATAGYVLAAGQSGVDLPVLADRFLQALERLAQRPQAAQRELATDQLLLLGLADGLAAVRRLGRPTPAGLEAWLISLLSAHPPADATALRLRDLALDILDRRGRLMAGVDPRDSLALAADLALRVAWADVFGASPLPDADARQRCLTHLLLTEPPALGDLGHAALSLGALEVLVRSTVAVLAPRVETIVEVLQRTQTAIRRWAWELTPRTRGAPLAQWQLDNEYHVQAVLWAVLYPIFGPALRDEEYLESLGFTQPRADLAVTTVRAIIEVKFARRASDFADIEEQVGGDLGLYFANPARFDHMLVYVYDDSDDHRPEDYDRLRNALRLRDTRIREVIIVRRPGQMPARAVRFGGRGRAATPGTKARKNKQ